MDGQAIITISASVVALTQLIKWMGLEDRRAPFAVVGLSLLGVVLWGVSVGTFQRNQSFEYFAAWIAVATSAAGVFGFVRSAPGALTSMKNPAITTVLLLGFALPCSALCDGTLDHTSVLQAQLDAASLPDGGPVLLVPGSLYCVNGNIGLNIRSDVRLELRGATIGMNPGCARAGFVCRVLNFLPGTARSDVLGPGVVEGDDSPGCLTCFSILVRVDSAEALLRRVTLRRSRSDLLWVGGNQKSSALIDLVTGDHAGRNLVSVVNAREVVITRSTFTDAYGPNPGACLDIEPNPGDSADHIAVLWSTFRNCRLGVVNQKGQGGQGVGFILAWSAISDIRQGDPGVPKGVTVNGVLGSVLFQNDITIPMWNGSGSVPLAGTVAGDTVALAAKDAYLLHNRIMGAVNDRGTPNPADDVFSGDFRFVNVNGLTSIGNVLVNGKFTQALAGVVGDDVRIRNSVFP